MGTIKKFAKYVIWIILFWILSDILIYYGLNSTYKDITAKNEIANQIEVDTAEATKVNGRIKGKIVNKEDNDLSGKYLKIDLYTEKENLLGTKYLDIGSLRENEVKNFETYFKMQNVKFYDISIVEEKEEDKPSDVFLKEDISKLRVLSLITYMIFF